jgi:hypothetical protein
VATPPAASTGIATPERTGSEQRLERLRPAHVPARFDPLRDHVVAAALLGRPRLRRRPHLPARERPLPMGHLDEIRPRLSVEELDDAARVGRLSDPIDRRHDPHHEARPASAKRRREATIANHPQPPGPGHGRRELGRTDSAHRCKLQGKLTADQLGEARAHSHHTDLLVVAPVDSHLHAARTLPVYVQLKGRAVWL